MLTGEKQHGVVRPEFVEIFYSYFCEYEQMFEYILKNFCTPNDVLGIENWNIASLGCGAAFDFAAFVFALKKYYAYYRIDHQPQVVYLGIDKNSWPIHCRTDYQERYHFHVSKSYPSDCHDDIKDANFIFLESHYMISAKRTLPLHELATEEIGETTKRICGTAAKYTPELYIVTQRMWMCGKPRHRRVFQLPPRLYFLLCEPIQNNEMFNPVLQALHELGGSGSIEEINRSNWKNR